MVNDLRITQRTILLYDGPIFSIRCREGYIRCMFLNANCMFCRRGKSLCKCIRDTYPTSLNSNIYNIAFTGNSFIRK